MFKSPASLHRRRWLFRVLALTLVCQSWQPLYGEEGSWSLSWPFATTEERPAPAPMVVEPTRPVMRATAQERRLLLEYNGLTTQKIQDLLASEARNSPRYPALNLVMGDRRVQEGEEAAARVHWESAAEAQMATAVSDEAQRRLFRLDDLPPFQVGVLLPLSGKYASLANSLLNAMRSALSHYRDTPVTLVPMDSANDPKTSRLAAEALASQNVSVILGPIFREEVRPAVEVASRAGIPILVFNPNREFLGQGGRTTIWLDALDPTQQARVMAHYARFLDKPRAAVLAPDSEYGQITADAFVREFTRLGGTVQATVHFPGHVQDLSPWIKSLRTGGQRPDVLFLPTTVEQNRSVIPQLTLMTGGDVVDLPLLLGTALWSRKELTADNAELLLGAAFCDIHAGERHFFRQAYHKVWHEDPPSLAQLAYDGVAVLAQLLRDQRLGGPAWQDSFARPEGFRGSGGNLYFNPDGMARHQYQVFQVGPEGVLPLPDLPPVQETLYHGTGGNATPASQARKPEAFRERSAFQPGQRQVP